MDRDRDCGAEGLKDDTTKWVSLVLDDDNRNNDDSGDASRNKRTKISNRRDSIFLKMTFLLVTIVFSVATG